LINFNDRDGSVAHFVVGIFESWRQGDQAHAVESQQELPAGHVL